MAPKRPYSGNNYPRSTSYARTSLTPYVPLAMTRTRVRTSRRPYRAYRRPRGPYGALLGYSQHTHPIFPKPEVKWYDQNQTGVPPTGTVTPTSMPQTGAIILLNDMNQNANANGFIGGQVSIKSCGYRFEVQLPNDGMNTAVPTSGRVVLIWDKQPNNAVAAWTDVFAQANYLAFTNMLYRERFVILRNQQFSLSPQGDESLFFEGYCNINMTTTYTITGAGATGSPLTGALLLAYISDQPDDTTQPQIAGTWRVRYIDN